MAAGLAKAPAAVSLAFLRSRAPAIATRAALATRRTRPALLAMLDPAPPAARVRVATPLLVPV